MFMIQVHGEWSGIPEYDSYDIDFVDIPDWESALKLIETEIPKGVPYIVYEDDVYLYEGLR